MGDRPISVAPRARREGCIARVIDREVVVYDRAMHKAYCLNESAALVWQHCDGRTTIEELRQLLQEKLGGSVSEQLVWYTLGRLAQDHLLEEAPEKPAGTMTRRELMQRLAAGGVVVAGLPTITSIIAPTAAAAGSFCLPNGAVCQDASGNVLGMCCPGSHCQVNRGNKQGHCSPD